MGRGPSEQGINAMQRHEYMCREVEGLTKKVRDAAYGSDLKKFAAAVDELAKLKQEVGRVKSALNVASICSAV